MANPQSGNVSLVEVGRDLMMESGNISLADLKYKDSVKKSNTSVSLRDFHKHVWGQGRTYVANPQASDMKPHWFDLGINNVASSQVTKGVTYDGTNGSPRWYGYWQGVRDIPSAGYFSGYCKLVGPNSLNLKMDIKTLRSTSYPWSGGSCNVAVWGYESGYFIGAQKQLLAYTPIATSGDSKTFSFTSDPYFPHLHIVVEAKVSAWNGVLGYETRGNFGFYDWRVYQA